MGQANQQWNIPCQLVKHKLGVIHQFVQRRLDKIRTTFVLTGDFNDYDFSTTAQILAGNELTTNLMAQHDAGDRYSYFYRGSNQVLDNIFISNNMAAKARFEPVHINASFMKEHGRASDHDPVLVQIDFSGAQTPGTPTDDQQGNTGQPTDQNQPFFIEYRISTSPSSDSSQ